MFSWTRKTLCFSSCCRVSERTAISSCGECGTASADTGRSLAGMGSLSSRLQPPPPPPTDEEFQSMAFHGTVVAVRETYGVLVFVLNKKEVRARFVRGNTCVDGRVVPQKTPLTSVIRVGMRAYLHFVETERDAARPVRYNAHVDVIETAERCPPQEYRSKEFRGTVVTEYKAGSKKPGVALIFLNGVEEKVNFTSHRYSDHWAVGYKMDIRGIIPRTTLRAQEARYEARDTITSHNIVSSQINTIVSFDPWTKSGSFYYDNYNGKLVIGFFVHQMFSYDISTHTRTDMTLPELASHIYAGQEIEIAGFPAIMSQYDVYRINVIIPVGGQSMFIFGRKLNDRPDLPSAEDKLSLDRLSLDMVTVDRATVDRVTVDRATVGRATVDRATVDRATVDRATVDRATVDRATVDRETVGRATVDRATVDRATVDRATVDRATVDRATVDRATVDRATVDRATVDWATVDRATVDWAAVDRATVDWATVDRATMDWATVDRATVDRATVDRATVGRVTVNRATVDWATVDRANVDRATVDRATVDRATVDRATVDRATVDRPTVDRATVDWATVDRATVDWATVDRATVDWATVDRANVDRATVDRATVDRTTVDRATVDRATMDRATVDRATVDRATVDRATVDRAHKDREHEDRATVDRATVDRATVDRTAVNSAALCKNTFLEAQQFPSNGLPAGPPAAARSDEFNLDNRREVASVERGARARTVDPGNERPSTSARKAEAAFPNDLVRREDTTPKVDVRNESASTSGQLTVSRYAENCKGDDLRAAENSDFVDRDETTVTKKSDVSIAQTGMSEWYSEEAFAEKYICGGRREARRTEYSIGETARTGFAGGKQSALLGLAKPPPAATVRTFSDLQIGAKKTGESKQWGKNETEVQYRSPNISERKVESRHLGVESGEQGGRENASGNSDRGPTAVRHVPGSTAQDLEAVGAKPAVANTVGKSKKLELSCMDKEVKKPTITAMKCSPQTKTGKPLINVVRPLHNASHDQVPRTDAPQAMEPTYSGIISSVSERSCVVAFTLNGRYEAARCYRADATLDGRPVQQDVSLKVTLEVGARAVLSHVEEHFGEADPDRGIRYKADVDVKCAQNKKVTIVPAATEKTGLCLSDLVVPGVVISVDDRFAVAMCRLDGLDEKVLFTRPYVYVVGTSAQQDTPLYDVVPRGTPLCDVIAVGARVTLSAFKPYSSGQDKTILYTARASVHRNDLCFARHTAEASVLPSSFNTTAELRPSSLNTTTEHKPSGYTAEFAESPLRAAAKLKQPPPSTVTKLKPSSFINTLDDLYNHTFLAVVFSLKEESGVATFQLNGKEQKARFTRANVNIDGVVVPQNVPLSETLSVGTEIVLRRVEEHNEHDLTVLYKGNVRVITRSGQLKSKDSLETKPELKISSTGAVPKQNVPKLQVVELKPSPVQILKEPETQMFDASDELYNREFPAFVYSLQKRTGVVKFKLEGDWQKARFTRANVYTTLYEDSVPQNIPLSETMTVGEEVLLLCVEEYGYDPTVLYKGIICMFRTADNLKTTVTQETSAQSTATLATNKTQPNITKLQPKDNLKTNIEVTKSLQGDKANISVVARSSKLLGTIETLDKSYIGGLAYFTHCGHKVTTLFVINELIIDNIQWNPLFSKDIIREGMIVTLSDVQPYEIENYSYFSYASIVTELSECQIVESRKPINYNPTVEKPSQIGVILSTFDTVSGRASPRVVAATINGQKDYVFVGDDEVAINGMPVTAYKHALPSGYFRVGMTVGLTKLKPCGRGSVGLLGIVASCTFEGSVECITDGTCFIDMLRASQKVSSLGKEIKPVPRTPLLKSVPTKESTPVEMGSNSAGSSTMAMTVVVESIAESGGGGGSSRLLIPEVERETDAGRAKVAVRLIKMSDGPRPAKCEMGTQTFITGLVVTKQYLGGI